METEAAEATEMSIKEEAADSHSTGDVSGDQRDADSSSVLPQKPDTSSVSHSHTGSNAAGAETAFKSPFKLPTAKPVKAERNKATKPHSTDDVRPPAFVKPQIEPDRARDPDMKIPPADKPKSTETKTAQPQKDSAPSEPRVPYKSPSWSGCPPDVYSLEVLRGGAIIDTLDLQGRPVTSFGRLPACDVQLEHPSISRFHAVLVYRATGDDVHPAGYYLYDLGSTHGTFVNKQQLQPRVYCRMRVGHMCKFGGSSRLFILQGPDEDAEEESELTVTELIQLRRQKEEAQRKLDQLEEDGGDVKKAVQNVGDEERQTSGKDGIDWGMGEDADESSDLQYNPFALGETNEQLYLDDPKKTLRGWFEREGFELEYITEDLPGAKHICRVELPLDTADGRPLVAEAQVQGKKKEAVIQCALEACRLLDRAGVLRQAKTESRQSRKKKRQQDSDSDEDDAFLDRTGAVERRRLKRAALGAGSAPGGASQQPETHQSLLKRYEELQTEITSAERRLSEAGRTAASGDDQQVAAAGPVDELDAFMTHLVKKQTGGDPLAKRKLRSELVRLRVEETRLRRLVNLARPASLPPLAPPTATTPAARAPALPIIGRRRGGVPIGPPRRAVAPLPPASQSEDVVEEEDDEGNVIARPRLLQQATPTNQNLNRKPHPQSNLTDKAVPDKSVTDSTVLSDRVTEHRVTDTGITGEGVTVTSVTGGGVTDASVTGEGVTDTSVTGEGVTDTSVTGGGVTVTSVTGEGVTDTSVTGGGVTDTSVTGGFLDTEMSDVTVGTHSDVIPVSDSPDLSSVKPETVRALKKPSCKDRARKERVYGVGRLLAEKEGESGGGYGWAEGQEKYDVWLPPAGQSGDGRTSLNDKYGY